MAYRADGRDPSGLLLTAPCSRRPRRRYFALNGINILLLIARVLKLMDFQPRLGVVTRSLWLAGPDLCHFAIVAGMVFVGYAMMGHLIFGNAIPVRHANLLPTATRAAPIQTARSSGLARLCFGCLLFDCALLAFS